MADKVKNQLVRKEDFEEAILADVPLITDYAQFKKLTAQNPNSLVIIDFFSESCSSCMAMLPAYSAVAHTYKDQAFFMKVDVGSRYASLRRVLRL